MVERRHTGRSSYSTDGSEDRECGRLHAAASPHKCDTSRGRDSARKLAKPGPHDIPVGPAKMAVRAPYTLRGFALGAGLLSYLTRLGRLPSSPKSTPNGTAECPIWEIGTRIRPLNRSRAPATRKLSE